MMLLCIKWYFSCCEIQFVLVNKQINDKERIAAAMENPNLKKIVEECISDES